MKFPSTGARGLKILLLLIGFLFADCDCAHAQNPTDPAKSATRSAIQGIVIKDPSGEAVKKAVIELIADNQAEGGNYTAETGSDGSFRIEGIVPGRYHLSVERTGYLEMVKGQTRGEGRILTIAGGQEVRDIQIHLAAAAVVSGRVTDEDGEPLQNAEVSVLRKTFASGRRKWEQLGSERTNDLGEYRVAGLPAGSYFVSVNPPPDFKSLIDGAAKEAPPRAPAGSTAEKTAVSYQTSYYPGTPDRSQAEAIELHAGDDFPVNFSLVPSPTLSVRGSVVNLPPQSTAMIMLQSRDFNVVLNGAEMHKDGSFVIGDVSPGSYTIVATVENGRVPMVARQALQVGSSNIEGLRLTPLPGGTIRGRLRVEGNGTLGRIDPGQMFLILRPADGDDDAPMFSMGDGFSYVTHVASDGTFEWRSVPQGNYYVRASADGAEAGNWYLKSVLAGGREADESGIGVNGDLVTLDVTASGNGGIVDGTVTNGKGEPVANAVVVAVPEPRLRGRIERFRKSITDQSGHFSLRGIAPGQYSLLAWDSVEGDAYYNPDFLKSYEDRAISLRVSEGDRKNAQLNVISGEEDRP